MPYELKESPETVQLSVSAPSREELFRAALTGVLAATYGAPLPEGTSEGRVVPVQAAGDDDDVLLAGLVERPFGPSGRSRERFARRGGWRST